MLQWHMPLISSGLWGCCHQGAWITFQRKHPSCSSWDRRGYDPVIGAGGRRGRGEGVGRTRTKEKEVIILLDEQAMWPVVQKSPSLNPSHDNNNNNNVPLISFDCLHVGLHGAPIGSFILQFGFCSGWHIPCHLVFLLSESTLFVKWYIL